MGFLDVYKSWLLILIPLLIVLVWLYLDELLAPRALGAILMLVPVPWLQAARLHPSPYTVVVSAVAYIMVIKGIALMLSPYLFRRGAEKFLNAPGNCRLWGSVGLLIDVILLVLAVICYR